MVTEVECIVDPGGTGDFASLNLAEDGDFGATNYQLTTNDEWVHCKCICTDGNADTTAALIYNFECDATRFIRVVVEVDGGYYHKGVFPTTGENKYRLEVSGARSLSVQFASYIQIIGLPVSNDMSAANGDCIYTETLPGVRICDCIVKGVTNASTAGGYGFHISFVAGSDADTTIYNNVVYNFKTSDASKAVGIYCNTGSSTDIRVFANVIYNCDYGVLVQGGPAAATNNITFDNTVDYHKISGGPFGSGTDYNATDGDGPGVGSNNVDLSGLSVDQVFFNAAAFNFSHATGSPAIATGDDLSAHFTTDILGDTRTQWSIGAFDTALEYIARFNATMREGLVTAPVAVDIQDSGS